MAGDIIEITHRLNGRAADIAQMLLPAGIRRRGVWEIGNVDGDKGRSMIVHLEGPRIGKWRDFASDEGGDLLDLWVAVRRKSLSEVLEDARAYLGMVKPEPYREGAFRQKSYKRPATPKCRHPQAIVLDYLSEVRCISSETIRRYKVSEAGDKIIFPFLLPDGTLALAKSREAVDGAKPVPTAADCEPILFGWQAIDPNARTIVITEGEIDALSFAEYGHPAMSVPFGGGTGGKQNWIENEFDRMARFEKIYIATDMDEPGEAAAKEITARLGSHRCYRVMLPKKDCNACLVDGVAKKVIDEAIANAATLDPEGLKNAYAYRDKVVRLFWPSNEERQGYSLPYMATRERLMFRPGEVTIWSGDSGSGKSQIISDSVPHWVQEGSRVCVASLEMQPSMTLKRMVKQTGGVDRPVENFIDQCLEFLATGVYLFERVGKASLDRLLEVFDYARAKYGCDQFIIDSFMRLGIASDDYDKQEAAVFQIVEWAVANNIHVHLVVHSRKGSSDRTAPETSDVKGAMEIGANAFNILTIWRNKKIEEVKKEDDHMTDSPGVVLNVAKQRNGDFEGKFKLWFSIRNYQYYSEHDNRRSPRCYVDMERAP